MKFAIKQFFLVYLATYFLVGNLGISFTQSTCLFTGNKKYSFDQAVSCCSKNTKPQFSQSNGSSFSRAKCCSYDRFALKFNFDQSENKLQKNSLSAEIFTRPTFKFPDIFVAKAEKHIQFYDSNHSPPPLNTRLAVLQVYQI